MKYKVTICRETIFEIIINSEDEDSVQDLAESYFESDRHLFTAIDEVYEAIDIKEIKG